MNKELDKELQTLITQVKFIFNTDDVGYTMERINLINSYEIKFTMWINQEKIMVEVYKFNKNFLEGEKEVLERVKQQLLLAGFMKYKEIGNRYEV